MTVPDSSRRPGLPAAGVVSLPAERQRIEIALERLSSDLKTLRVDYERFFSGALRTPPEDLRQRIAQELREHRAHPLRERRGVGIRALASLGAGSDRALLRNQRFRRRR